MELTPENWQRDAVVESGKKNKYGTKIQEVVSNGCFQHITRHGVGPHKSVQFNNVSAAKSKQAARSAACCRKH
jgi:hypothetical protein